MSDKECLVQQTDPSPFHLIGSSDAGVLLLHGFSGTPREMFPLGQYLHSRSLTVHAPLLPGHGTTITRMNQSTWHEWVTATRSAFDTLDQLCQHTFIAGFSMGSLLALWAAIHKTPTKGLILYSPATKVADWRIGLTPIMKHVITSISAAKHSDLVDPTAERYLGGFKRYPVVAAAEFYKLQQHVRAQLNQVNVPVCVIYSSGDTSIHPRSGQLTVEALSKVVPVETLILENSGHAVVVDREWEQVAEKTYQFIVRNTSENTSIEKTPAIITGSQYDSGEGGI